MKYPLISVIIPSYNHDKFIEQSIISVIEQSYTNIELIVIDDGSKDNSIEIIKKLQNKYKFKYYEQSNKGLTPTLNKAIREYVNGDYFSLCASDDFFDKQKIEKQYNFLRKNPKFSACYGKGVCIDENNQILIRQTKNLNRGLKGGDIFDELLLIKFHPPVSFLYNTKEFSKLGVYREDLIVEDLYMNLKLAENGPIGYLNEFLFYYRLHCNNTINNNTVRLLNDQRKIIDNYQDYPKYNLAIQKWRLRKAYYLCQYKNSKFEAFVSLTLSLKFFFSRMFISSLLRLVIIWK